MQQRLKQSHTFYNTENYFWSYNKMDEKLCLFEPNIVTKGLQGAIQDNTTTTNAALSSFLGAVKILLRSQMLVEHWDVPFLWKSLAFRVELKPRLKNMDQQN